MTSRNLIAKLNNLGKTEPDQTWLNGNRELLLSQISNSGGQKLSAWRITLITFSSLAKTASQPAIALGVFVLLLLTGGLFGAQLFAQTKPNDSLYIARIISEKVRLNTTFNSAERNKLEVQYASEHAQAISAILSDPSFNNAANGDQVAKLNNSFNKEVNTVKDKISRLKASDRSQATSDNSAVNLNLDVAIANNSKDVQGIQLLENTTTNATFSANASTTVKGGSAFKGPELASSTNPSVSSSTLLASSTSLVEVAPVDANKILEEAQKLFDSKDYNKASEKLKEVDQIIK